MNRVELRAAALGYGATPVLTNIDLRIEPGERIALVGGNGAGKTTLLRALAGLLPVPTGAVAIGGHAIGSPTAAVAAGVGLVFQNPDDQLFGATVIEDVLFGPRNLGLDEPTARAQAISVLETLGLGALAERPVESLSFGEKKRACLAGVLVMRPSLLLLDEPTAGLDPAGEQALVKLLDQLHRERPLTLLLASHAIDLIPYLADRVLLLDRGQIRCDGTPSELLWRSDDLERAHLRTPWVTRLHHAFGRPAPHPLTVEQAKEQW